jgi:hypothetical protein
MPRKKPLTKCDSCDATVRVSRLSSHKIHRCTNRPYTCIYCHLTVSHREYLQNHDVSCDQYPMLCRYCHEYVLYGDLIRHTTECTQVKELIQKYKEYDSKYVSQATRVLRDLTKNARIKFTHCGYKMQLNHLINTGGELEALICAKQFSYDWLYRYVVNFHFEHTVHSPTRYCLLDDMELILGEYITHEYVEFLLKSAGFRTRTEWNGLFIHARLFCDEKSYCADFIYDHYFSQYNKSKKEMKNMFLSHLTVDTTSILMKYVFADKLIVTKGRLPSTFYLSPC